MWGGEASVSVGARSEDEMQGGSQCSVSARSEDEMQGGEASVSVSAESAEMADGWSFAYGDERRRTGNWDGVLGIEFSNSGLESGTGIDFCGVTTSQTI